MPEQQEQAPTEGRDGWVHRMLAHDKATEQLGIEILSVAPGRATAQMTVREDMCNGHLTTHGGFVFALADTTFAVACNSHGDPTVASGAQIRYIAPTRAGDVLTAEAVERAKWGRSGIYDVSVSCGGKVVAEFRGDSRIVPPPAGVQ